MHYCHHLPTVDGGPLAGSRDHGNTQHWLHKRRRISLVAERLLGSEKGCHGHRRAVLGQCHTRDSGIDTACRYFVGQSKLLRSDSPLGGSCFQFQKGHRISP
jgi:hypothetical protein